MRSLTLTILLLAIVAGHSPGQTRIYTDRGHWVGLGVGVIGGDGRFADRWTARAMYDWRFDTFWSLPVEASAFKRVSIRYDGAQLHSHSSTVLALSIALKLRVVLGRLNTDFFAQAGVGAGSMYPVIHYAYGVEYGIAERLALTLQVRRHTSNLEVNNNFYTLGVNLNLTSDRLREEYLNDR